MTGFAFDTNLLVYVDGVEQAPSDGVKVIQSRRLLDNLLDLDARIVVPAQALAELHNVLLVKKRLHPAECSRRVSRWIRTVAIESTDVGVINDALTLAATASLRIFDAVILAAAAEAGCDLLVSEDFQDGFRWRGVTVTNPFGPSPDPRLPLD